MHRFVAPIVILMVISPSLSAGQSLASYAEGKQFWVDVWDNDLLKSPAWKSDAENPPLSARRVIQLATEFRKQLVNDTKTHKWAVVAAELWPDTSVDRWYWKIRFENGVGPHLQYVIIVVLMDGTIVKPKIYPHH